MVQSGKCRPCKNEDLSLTSRTHVAKLGVVVRMGRALALTDQPA